MATPDVERPPVEVPRFGEPVFVLRKAKHLIPRYRTAPNLPLRWLHETVDVAFTKSHFIIVAASPGTAARDIARKAAERLPALGLLGGVLGVAVFSAGNIAERVFGESNDISNATLNQMVQSGVAIYAPKSELQFKHFGLKRTILYFYNEIHVAGLFTWQDQTIDLCLRFNDEDMPDTTVKRYFQRGECEVEDHPKRMTAQDVNEIRAKSYPVGVGWSSLPQ
jgi:hypothetical protein